MKVITSDVNAKIFAQYLGAEFMYSGTKYNSTSKLDLYSIKLMIEDDDFNECTLVLNSLQNISDEDAIEMAEIFGGINSPIVNLNRPTDLQNEDIHFSVQVFVKEPKFMSYSTPKYWSDVYGVKAYQWLTSKGYALPYMDYSVEELVELGVYKLI